MRVRTPGRVIAALLLVLLPAACSSGLPLTPAFYNYYSAYTGFQENETTWFTCTAASSIAFADSTFFATVWDQWFPEEPVLAPTLGAALDTVPRVARPMYLVVNSGQGPVFDTRPGLSDYSGLWQVFLIRFYPGFNRTVTNTSSGPQGLPSPSEGEIVETDTVLNCPILAIGTIGNPAYPAPPGTYRIKQAAYWVLGNVPTSVLLPIYLTYVSDPVSGRPVMAGISITDAETQELADMFGANLAPRLAAFPGGPVNNFWLMNSPCPPGQLPVLEEAPWWQARAYNQLYCPVARYVRLGRLIPPSSTISNRALLLRLLGMGLLFETSGGQRININLVEVSSGT